MVARFISADSTGYLGLSNSILSYNLLSYCENTPIQGLDITGCFGTPLQWICAIIGGIAGWFFGDFVARKIGLFPKGKGFFKERLKWFFRGYSFDFKINSLG